MCLWWFVLWMMLPFRGRIYFSRTTSLLTINSNLHHTINYDNKHINKHGINQRNTMPINANCSSKVPNQRPRQSARTSTQFRTLLHNVLERALKVPWTSTPFQPTFDFVFVLPCLSNLHTMPCLVQGMVPTFCKASFASH